MTYTNYEKKCLYISPACLASWQAPKQQNLNTTKENQT